MDKMQFRGFVFPHNPQSITVSSSAQVAAYFCPGLGEYTQDMGRRGRTVRCGGCFFGENAAQALAQLSRFRQEADGGRTGMLYLPGVEPFMATLREFVFEEQGDGCILPYTMVFAEAEGGA